MKVITLGDSVLWGQGLLDKQKMHVLAARAIADLLHETDIEIVHTAHSGAVLCATDEHRDEPTYRGPNWKEVPQSLPSVREQLESIAPQVDEDARLCFLNGGINDINFRTMLDPRADAAALSELDESIRQSCYVDMRDTIQAVRERLPNAVIVVLGYYPILSEHTDLDVLDIAAPLVFVVFGVGLGVIVSSVLAPIVVRRMRYFHRRQLSWLRKAVTECHSDSKTRGPGVLFAHPGLGPLHSVGAPDSLLWSPKQATSFAEWKRLYTQNPAGAILMVEPDDPMGEARRAACGNAHPNGDLQCDIAAIGHPTAEGAQRYAEAIVESFTENHRFSVRESLLGARSKERKISLRKVARPLNRQEGRLSLRRHLVPVARVDCIDVDLRTRNRLGAGTDHDLYLSTGPNARWKLTQSTSEGDWVNELEMGSTHSYSVDPLEGQPDRRMRFGDVVWFKLHLEADPLVASGDNYQPSHVSISVNGIELYAASEETTMRVGDELVLFD